MITSIFERVGIEISNTFLGSREQARIGMTYGNALVEIKRRIEAGDIPRNDNFYKSEKNERSKAETLLEGVLIKAKQEYEEKKIKYYSYFLANLTFDESTDYYKASTLLRLAEQLSYRQIIIIAFFYRQKEVNIGQWDISFLRNSKLQIYHDFYTELMDLYNKQLIQQTGRDGISMGLHELTSSPIGNKLSQLMNLDKISHDDIQEIDTTISTIKMIIKS